MSTVPSAVGSESVAMSDVGLLELVDQLVFVLAGVVQGEVGRLIVECRLRDARRSDRPVGKIRTEAISPAAICSLKSVRLISSGFVAAANQQEHHEPEHVTTAT